MMVSRWLSRLPGTLGFRLRLLRLALRPLDRVPAAVVMALEPPEYDVTWLDYRADESRPPGRWV